MDETNVTNEALETQTEGTEPEPKSKPESGKVDPNPKDAKSDAAKAEAAKKEAARKLKLKVDGKEEEVDEEEVVRRAQKASAAEKRFQEAAEERKRAAAEREQVRALLTAARDNPVELFKRLGVDVDEWAEKRVYERFQTASMSPEERERAREREELEQYRQRDAQAKEEREQREREELKAKYRADYTKQFTEVLGKGGVPVTDWTLQRTAGYMRQAIAQGHKHIGPADVVDMVRQDWINAQRAMFQNLDGDKLIEMLGEDVADKVRRAQVAKAQTTLHTKTTAPSKEPQDEKEPKRYRSTSALPWNRY